MTRPRSTFKDQLSVASINAVTVECSVPVVCENQIGNNREVCFRLDNDIADHKQFTRRLQPPQE